MIQRSKIAWKIISLNMTTTFFGSKTLKTRKIRVF